MKKPAILWESRADGRVLCYACARKCLIPSGSHGFCYVRENIDGALYLSVYGKLAAMQIDPIEKKPFNHFYPGTHVFTVGTVSCNWHCHPAGTGITLADGTARNVETLEAGDTLWSYDVVGDDVSRSVPRPNVVTETRTRKAELWAIWWDGTRATQEKRRKKTFITADHPVLTRNGWKQVQDLKLGDYLLSVWAQTSSKRKAVQYNHADQLKQLVTVQIQNRKMKNDKQWVRLLDVMPTGQFTTVYGFECIPNHTYVADGILVHNCSFCQNHNISKETEVYGEDVGPEEVPALATEHGCEGVGFSYNEPTIFIEYVIDTAREAHNKGLYTVFVTNGYATPEAVKASKGYVDAAVIDYKGSGELMFQRKQTMTVSSEPVKEALLEYKRQGIHTELTDLIIPEVGENLEEAEKLCKWLYDNLGPDIPIQFTAFHPDYKLLNIQPTPYTLLVKHYEAAKKIGLNYVYIGNAPGTPYEHTYCPGCQKPVIERYAYIIKSWNLDAQNRCKFCGYQIPITGHRAKRFHYRDIESFYIPNPKALAE